MSAPETHEDRCRGDCCRYFCLSLSYDHAKQHYEAWKRGENPALIGDEWCYVAIDIDVIFPMLILCGLFEANPFSGHKYDEPVELFECVNLVGNECKIYENRPGMCRIHPSNGECHHHDCKMSPQKQREHYVE